MKQALLRTQAYINGKWCGAKGGGTFDVIDPATGKVLASVPKMGALETKQAIQAAHQALAPWQARTGKDRAKILRQWFNLIVQHRQDLALLMSQEQGKPLAEARGEIDYAASFIEWFAEEAKRIYGELAPAPVAGRRIMILKQPVGVCAAITPWNFPAAMITRKAGPALAAGCTMVVKPASQTPLTALALAELADIAGIPPGVLNVVTGTAGEIGGELMSDPLVRKITFTGSTEIGKVLIRQSADTVKRVSMELGGNAPFIVFEDADIDLALQGAMDAKFRNGGQACIAANRIFVHECLYDEFCEKFATKVLALSVGNGQNDGTDVGPMIDVAAVEKINEHVADACAKGAKVIAGGRPHALGGTFYEPTVLIHVQPNMTIACEETFGPLAPILKFVTDDEVIEAANSTQYGLAAYVFTRSIERVMRIPERLDFGIVGVNLGLISNEVMPFGGVKESGIGREGSSHGIEEYLEIKSVTVGGM